MFSEKEFIKDYPKTENLELVVEIVHDWFKMIPMLKEGSYTAVFKTGHYMLKMTGDEEIRVLYRSNGGQIEEVTVPEHAKKYLLYTFEHFGLYQEIHDDVHFKDMEHLFEKFDSIRQPINAALYASFTQGRVNGYKWANVADLTEKEFMGIVPQIIQIAYNCNDFGFSPNIVLSSILELILVNTDESLSCESYWRIALDCARIQMARINVVADDREKGLDETGITAYRMPEFVEKTVGDILTVNEPWYWYNYMDQKGQNRETVSDDVLEEDEMFEYDDDFA
ncbi:MAG: hypothetical protein HFJ05_04075 [Eubacterium sp.]|nr:hypothetical protein [Eubacterium sp.]